MSLLKCGEASLNDNPSHFFIAGDVVKVLGSFTVQIAGDNIVFFRNISKKFNDRETVIMLNDDHFRNFTNSNNDTAYCDHHFHFYMPGIRLP